jgi:putative ABC transport system ATP-binding protein
MRQIAKGHFRLRRCVKRGSAQMGNDHEKVSSSELLLNLLRGEAQDTAIVIMYGAGVGMLSLAVPIGVQSLVNNVTFGTLSQPVVFLVVAVLVGLCVAALLRTIQVSILERFQKRFFVRVAVELAYRIPRLDSALVNRGRFPELVNRFFDVLTVQKSAAHLLLEGFAVALQMILALLLLSFYHPVLMVFALCLLTSISIIIFVLGRGAVDTAIHESVQKYRVAAYLEEIAGLPSIFRTAAARDLAIRHTDGLLCDYLDARESHFRVLLRQIIGSYALQAVASSLLLGLGAYLVTKQQLSIGQLVAAEIVVTAALSSLSKFQKHLESFYDLVAALDKINGLLSFSIESSGGERLPAPAVASEVEIKGLSFGYSRANWSFANLNFKLDKGVRAAVLGGNGSGKSTFVDLLYGQIRPEGGTVLLNQLDLRNIRIEDVRDQVSLARGIEFFNGTVIENLRAGRMDITLESIYAVLRSLDLLDDILSLPSGLDTTLDMRGAPLTISQALRLVLARSIIVKPTLLLVDEVLDGLDGRARASAIRTLLDSPDHFTILVTTHNPEIASHFDYTIRLNELVTWRAA